MELSSLIMERIKNGYNRGRNGRTRMTQDYRSCMTGKMKGLKGISKEQRRLEFCISAKECSKGLPRDEAKKLCLEPKPPKPPKQRKSAKQLEKEREACNPEVFTELIKQFNNVYVEILAPRCPVCSELDGLIRATDLPYQVVQIPESCIEIQDLLEVDAFPTIVYMRKGKIVDRFVGKPETTIEKMKQG